MENRESVIFLGVLTVWGQHQHQLQLNGAAAVSEHINTQLIWSSLGRTEFGFRWVMLYLQFGPIHLTQHIWSVFPSHLTTFSTFLWSLWYQSSPQPPVVKCFHLHYCHSHLLLLLKNTGKCSVNYLPLQLTLVFLSRLPISLFDYVSLLNHKDELLDSSWGH